MPHEKRYVGPMTAMTSGKAKTDGIVEVGGISLDNLVEHLFHASVAQIRLIVSKTTDDETSHTLEHTSQHQLVKHAIYAVHSFTRILDKKNNILLSKHVIWSICQGTQYAHITAHEQTLPLAVNIVRMRSLVVRREVTEQELMEHLIDAVLLRIPTYALYHIGMDTLYTSLNLSTQERCDVTKAYDPFGIASESIKRYFIEQLGQALTTACTDDRFNLRIAKGLEQIATALVDCPGIAMIVFERIWPHSGTKSPLSQNLHTRLNLLSLRRT